MKNDYAKMSDDELQIFVKNMQCKIEDLEDERSIILEKSQGNHVSSEYVQSNINRLNDETESVNSIIKEAEAEMENRKNI